MRPKVPVDSRGFTLIELLIVLAIVSLIIALLVPSLLDSLQKGKQKRTLADERNVGAAWMSWHSDQVQAAAAGQGTTHDWPFGISNPAYDRDQLQQDLDGSGVLTDGARSPEYIKMVPTRDGWGNPYEFALNDSNLFGEHVLAIRSPARDGKTGNTVSACDDDQVNQPGSHGYFDQLRFDCDIIWKDGYFVQAPAAYRTLAGTAS